MSPDDAVHGTGRRHGDRDAVVVSRALTDVGSDEIGAALERYEHAHQDRTARIQIGSRSNNWLKESGNADWVYGYDVWTVPLT